MNRARSGVDYCRHCSVSPRHPCRDYNFAEIARCPNASEWTREWARDTAMTSTPWIVTTTIGEPLNLHGEQKEYGFFDEGQARMFLDSCRRDGERCEIRRAA